MARRHDPERRQRIIDAALRVVARDGIAGLGHRAVAAEADVPLGSTTYHFAGLDDLLVAALRQANDAWLDGIRRWEAELPPGAPFARALAELIVHKLTADRTRAALEYELYLAALRHESVRPLAAECLDELTVLLRRRTGDDTTARALTSLMDGLMIQSLLTGRPCEVDELRTLIARLLG
ncbi:TetR family transcriptional regulator [Streptomyces sp. 549]|uniref:TetR/AcrR family transcriptional regulator n=1 Tax=Streptomyces sp. 549 TaxID=3049076 RepID=UPI0024C270A5|nr:TetR family transcriptional regulator [Streptomyces sp. 549]MDK1474217.1 TetR family transcriptional regulator [Streptomyces sp. 549]